jgi:hypothetical protein
MGLNANNIVELKPHVELMEYILESSDIDYERLDYDDRIVLETATANFTFYLDGNLKEID